MVEGVYEVLDGAGDSEVDGLIALIELLLD